MKKLHDNPNVTLVFSYTYQGVPITLTIPGSSVELDPKIQWYGNVVTCKRYPGEMYEIGDTDVFGVGDRDPIYRVFGAKDRTNNKDIRIDMQNYPSWDVLSD